MGLVIAPRPNNAVQPPKRASGNDEPGEPGVGLRTPAHLSGTRLGAHRQVAKLALAMLVTTLLRIISFRRWQVSAL